MQCRRQHLSDHRRLLVYLPFGEAQNLETSPPQVEIAGAVVLEGHLSSVVEITVGFDHHPSLRPEKVDEMRSDPYVDLWLRQAVTAAQSEEVALEVAASAVVAIFITERQAKHAGLANCTAQLPSRKCAGVSVAVGETKVGDGPSRASHWNAPMDGHLARCQRDRTMNPNARSPCPPSDPMDDHVNGPVGVASQAPEERRTAMADGRRPAIEHLAQGITGPIAKSQNRRQESPLRGKGGVADRVHPAMDAMQPPSKHAGPHCIVTYPDATHLA